MFKTKLQVNAALFILKVLMNTVVLGKHTTCDDGWTANEGYCYRISDDSKDFTEAEVSKLYSKAEHLSSTKLMFVAHSCDVCVCVFYFKVK